MEWTIEYLQEPGVLAVTTSGTLTLESLCMMVAAGMAEAARHRTRRVLVDHSRTAATQATLDIFRAPVGERDIGVAALMWVAVVRPDATVTPDDLVRHDLGAANAGLQRRVFNDRTLALAWLASRPNAGG